MGVNPYAHVLSIWGLARAICGDFEYGERLLEKALSFLLEIDHISFHLRPGECVKPVKVRKKNPGGLQSTNLIAK
jgi:predicted urease superfamily metal-dependent hydrolase